MEEQLKSKMKEVFKVTATILVLTLAISVVTSILEGLYDHRVILGVLAGAYGYEPLKKVVSKLKALN